MWWHVKPCEGFTQVRVAVGGQSKRTAEAEGRENLDWEETMVRAHVLRSHPRMHRVQRENLDWEETMVRAHVLHCHPGMHRVQRENLDWEETMVRAMCCIATREFIGCSAKTWTGRRRWCAPCAAWPPENA